MGEFFRGRESVILKTRAFWIAVSVVLALTVFGCSNKSSEEAQEQQPPPPTATVDPATAGNIVGTVRLAGDPPDFRPIDMSAEPECVKVNPKPVVPPIVVTGAHGALANVAVFVKSGLGRYKYDTPSDPAVLNQKGCMYEPRILALRVGQPLEVHNEDPTVHNINVRARKNHSWNRSEEPGEPAFTETFKHAELDVPVSCNVHPWMRAYLFIFDNPYYDVTTKTGDFELKGLPPGTYTIEARQEFYGVLDQSVTLGPKETKKIEFVFKAPADK